MADEFTKPLPVTATIVPPDTKPLRGEMPLTRAIASDVNLMLAALKSTPLLDTDNDTSPASNTGVMQLISLDDTNVAATLCNPNRTIRFGENTKPVPRTVTLVPPDDGPSDGSTTVNATASVNRKATALFV